MAARATAQFFSVKFAPIPPNLHRVFLDEAREMAADLGAPDRKILIDILLAQHPARDFFREGSVLRQKLLEHGSHEDMVEPLRRALAGDRDHAGVALLYREAAEHGWAVKAHEDLAFCKPALSSSVCAWSRYPDRERDACGANGDPPQACHTDVEEDPWWMVDLLEEHGLEEVPIVNRHNQPERFTQSEPRDVSTDLDWPLRIHFSERLPSRYVRVVLLGPGPLHLTRVQVFGGSISGRVYRELEMAGASD